MGIVQVSILNFYRLYIDHLTIGQGKASFARKLAMCLSIVPMEPKRKFQLC